MVVDDADEGDEYISYIRSARGFYVEAYQESAPTVRGSFNVYMPTGKTWRFHHWICRGNAYLDDYREFNTGGLVWTPDEREGFSYDALDRLVGGSPVSGAQGYTVTYGYDPTGNITYAMGLGAYVYGAAASGCATGTVTVKPHAVTQAGSNTYVYDCTGNVTRRVELSGTQMVTYYQEYDAENRLVAVTNTVTSLVTRFAYDGDGNRVKVTAGTTTTVYIGTYYEQQGTTVTRYYYLGGQRVAMRVGPAGQAGTVTYLHVDHLGSTSLATTGSGQEMPGSRTWYYPYGGIRDGGEGLPTDYTFTGQWSGGDVRLVHMGARWYHPQIGRWMSADTIVPDPANPQSFNRYSYVLGNPLRFSDPGGHTPIDICAATQRHAPGCGNGPVYAGSTLVDFSGKWGVRYRENVVGGTEAAAARLYEAVQADRQRAYAIAPRLGGNPSDYSAASQLWGLSQDDLFLAAYGGQVTFERSDANCANCWAETNASNITVYANAFDAASTYPQYGHLNTAHELGHAFSHNAGRQPYDDLDAIFIRDAAGNAIAGGGGTGTYTRRNAGYVLTPPNNTWPWQQNTTASASEDFADMFLNWSYSSFDNDQAGAGAARNRWVTVNTPRWMALAVAGN